MIKIGPFFAKMLRALLSTLLFSQSHACFSSFFGNTFGSPKPRPRPRPTRPPATTRATVVAYDECEPRRICSRYGCQTQCPPIHDYHCAQKCIIALECEKYGICEVKKLVTTYLTSREGLKQFNEKNDNNDENFNN